MGHDLRPLVIVARDIDQAGVRVHNRMRRHVLRLVSRRFVTRSPRAEPGDTTSTASRSVLQ